MQKIVANHRMLPTRANQNKCMKALPNSEMNSLSPLVVSKPKIPFRGDPPGTFFSQISITVIHNAIKIKKAAVCQVQAIQENKSKSKKPFSFAFPTSPQVAAFNFENIKPFPLQILLQYNL